MQKLDAIIIGTGQGGPSLAARLVDAGMKIARNSFGRTCVNTGYIPDSREPASSAGYALPGSSAPSAAITSLR
jgi:pyruvate/2-oxoglutarate dehydrogenase complex dihydrolipoamide dehydrogenase (E3) component